MDQSSRLTPVTAPDFAVSARRAARSAPGCGARQSRSGDRTHLGLGGVDHNDGGVLTAARAVNAIDAVCAAPPGLLSVKDYLQRTATR